MKSASDLDGEETNLLLLKLAHQLLAHGETADAIELVEPTTQANNDGGAFVHSPHCRGFCGYACGAVFIGYARNADDEIEVREIEVGTLRVAVGEV